jgi:hypothetical protein
MIAGVQGATIAAGITIPVRTNDTIDAKNTGNGRVYSAVVAQDVLDHNGRIAIPRGADAELMVRDIGHHTLALDLDAVVVNGERYSVTTYDVTRSGEQKDGIGANGRTGKFIGGGALFGTLLGAVAGGEMATRGRRVRVPAESLLTFQLQQPLNLARDRGYTRNGQHYHPPQTAEPE